MKNLGDGGERECVCVVDGFQSSRRCVFVCVLVCVHCAYNNHT